MKKLFLLLLVSFLFVSCKKEKAIVPDCNSTLKMRVADAGQFIGKLTGQTVVGDGVFNTSNYYNFPCDELEKLKSLKFQRNQESGFPGPVWEATEWVDNNPYVWTVYSYPEKKYLHVECIKQEVKINGGTSTPLNAYHHRYDIEWKTK